MVDVAREGRTGLGLRWRSATSVRARPIEPNTPRGYLFRPIRTRTSKPDYSRSGTPEARLLSVRHSHSRHSGSPITLGQALAGQALGTRRPAAARGRPAVRYTCGAGEDLRPAR
jgi:hypothetical protein